VSIFESAEKVLLVCLRCRWEAVREDWLDTWTDCRECRRCGFLYSGTRLALGWAALVRHLRKI
jgi:hypothetical protein